MRRMRAALACVLVTACGGGGDWLQDPHVLVPGVGTHENVCTTKICPHNENTDLVDFDGAIYLVHRTAQSQILGPNSSLHIYRSDDGGASFQDLATIEAPQPPGSVDLPGDMGRDLRDPSLYVVDGKLTLKALTRLPVNSSRDSDVDTITVASTSDDGGHTWSPLAPIAPPTWSFWRVKEHDGSYYSAAYEDGDRSVKLFASPDGVTWSAGAPIYTTSEDTPLETELVFMPSGKLMALVRMDGTDAELLGAKGRLRTAVCWSDAPYTSWDCPQVLDGQRLDGPVAFFHGDRLFVIARSHIQDAAESDRKRTTLFELGGELEGGPITITALGDFPSGGDTSYAGVADVDADHALVTWYSSDVKRDDPWVMAIFFPAVIWHASIDFSEL
jgi:hypothetical protein